MHSEDQIIKELNSIKELTNEIRNAIGVFGSARINEGHDDFIKAFEISKKLAKQGYSMISGGGPGLMRAVNKGAFSEYGKSVGFNIDLDFEPLNLEFQNVSLVFNNFFSRKLAFATHSDAFIVMPGGVGTLDELFEILTLIQTKKIKKTPVILINKNFWAGLLDWMRKNLEENNLISKNELNELILADDVDDVISIINSLVPLKN